MIRVQADGAAIRRSLDNYVKGARWALRRAVNEVATDVKTALVGEMRATFYKPTPFVLNSLMIDWARDDDLAATVRVKDLGARGGVVSKALMTQIAGGTRAQKRSEQRLTYAAPGGDRVFMMPARFAKLDAYGNPSKGELTAILSQVGVLNRGDNKAARTSKRTRKTRDTYFAVFATGEALSNTGEALKPGIYRQHSSGRPLPVYVFFKAAPQYRRRLAWHEVAERTVAARSIGHVNGEMAAIPFKIG